MWVSSSVMCTLAFVVIRPFRSTDRRRLPLERQLKPCEEIGPFQSIQDNQAIKRPYNILGASASRSLLPPMRPGRRSAISSFFLAGWARSFVRCSVGKPAEVDPSHFCSKDSTSDARGVGVGLWLSLGVRLPVYSTTSTRSVSASLSLSASFLGATPKPEGPFITTPLIITRAQL